MVVNWRVDLAKEVRRRVLEAPEGHAAKDETSAVETAYLVREMSMDADEWVEARYAACGGEVYRVTYRKAVQAYPSNAGKGRGHTQVGRGGARRADKGSEGGGVAPLEA